MVNVSTNSSNTAAVSLVSHETVLAWYCCMVVIYVVGTLMTFLLLLAIIATPSLRRGSGLLIVELLVVGLVLCAGSTPALHTTILRTFHTSVRCDIIFSTYLTFFHIGNWCSLFLAIHRLAALSSWKAYVMLTSPRSLIVCLITTMIIPVCCVDVSQFVYNAFLYGQLPVGGCSFLRINNPKAVLITSVFGVYLPYATEGLVYLLTLWYMRKSGSVVRVGKEYRQQQRRLVITRMLICAYICSLICAMLPPVISRFPLVYRYERMVLFMRSLQTIPFAANPIIFVYVNQDYQVAVRRLMRRMNGGSNSVGNTQSSCNAVAPSDVKAISGATSHHFSMPTKSIN